MPGLELPGRALQRGALIIGPDRPPILERGSHPGCRLVDQRIESSRGQLLPQHRFHTLEIELSQSRHLEETGKEYQPCGALPLSGSLAEREERPLKLSGRKLPKLFFQVTNPPVAVAVTFSEELPLSITRIFQQEKILRVGIKLSPDRREGQPVYEPLQIKAAPEEALHLSWVEPVDLPDESIYRQEVAALTDPVRSQIPARTPMVITIETAQRAGLVKQDTLSKFTVNPLDVVAQTEKPAVDQYDHRFRKPSREPDRFSGQGGETLTHPGKIKLLGAEQ